MEVVLEYRGTRLGVLNLEVDWCFIAPLLASLMTFGLQAQKVETEPVPEERKKR